MTTQGAETWRWWTRNEDGFWCDVCGNLLAAKHQFGCGRQDKQDMDEYEPPFCQQCGAPDEIDPEAI